MTIAFEVRIRYLITEFFTNALVFLRPFQSAGAVATGAL